MLDIRFRQGAALVALSLSAPMALYAQAPAMSRQAGTVTAVDGSAVTIKTAAGAVVVVTVAPDAKVVQVPPGAKDLSAATPATVGDVSVGDKVLANGTAPDASKLTAVRVIVMKSTDINAMHASEEREWQRGLGGREHGYRSLRGEDADDSYDAGDGIQAVCRRFGGFCQCAGKFAGGDSSGRSVAGTRNGRGRPAVDDREGSCHGIV